MKIGRKTNNLKNMSEADKIKLGIIKPKKKPEKVAKKEDKKD